MDIETAKTVYKKLHDGDSIDNIELNKAIKVFSLVEDFLHVDPHLHLAWKEIHYDLIALEGYREARKR